MKLVFFILSLLVITTSSYSQYKFLEFKLDISPSFLHSSNHIEIELTYDTSHYYVKAKSTPLGTDIKYTKNKIDTIYIVNNEQISKIGNLLNALSSEQIFNGMNVDNAMIANEGITCKLEYGTYLDKISFSIWSPNYRTHERKLELFYHVCNEILILGKINPKKVF